MISILGVSVGGVLGCHGGVAAPAPAAAARSTNAAAPTCDRVTAPFAGSICSPGDARRHPAIVLFGGYQPGDAMRETALSFASTGYVAASVAYFGVEGAEAGTPPYLVDVPVEIGGRALATLAERPDVDPERIAVMGGSKGGEYALLVASTYPAVRAVVASVPSPFALFGLDAHGVPTGCSWSRDGKELPCVAQDRAAGQAVWRAMQDHEPVAFRPSNDASRTAASPETMKAAFFALERIHGPVLCLAADDDQTWNSRVHCELSMAYLREHQHPFADRMIAYPDAGHLFLDAQSGPQSAMNRLRRGPFEMVFGGTPEGDARAADDAWPQIHAFLAAALR